MQPIKLINPMCLTTKMHVVGVRDHFYFQGSKLAKLGQQQFVIIRPQCGLQVGGYLPLSSSRSVRWLMERVRSLPWHLTECWSLHGSSCLSELALLRIDQLPVLRYEDGDGGPCADDKHRPGSVRLVLTEGPAGCHLLWSAQLSG